MMYSTIRFGDLYAIDSRNGLSKPSKIRGSGYKMINMGELFANDRIYDIPMELVPLKDPEKINAKVEVGDLLFARQSLVLEGAGKCSIVMEVSPLTVFESHLIRVRLKDNANPVFYYYYLWGRFMKKVSISKEDLEELQNQISGLNNDIITKDENLKELVNELDKIQNVMDFQGEDIVSIDAVPLKTWDLLSKAQVVINNGSTSYNFPIDKHGQGTQSVAAILLFKAYVKILLNEMSREEAEAILTLEEPEAHLHPQAVRSLHKSIDEIECQKIITTHSPYFIQNMDLKNLRYVRKENGETKIAKIFDRYVFSVSDIPEGLIRLSSRFSNVIEVDGNLNIVTIKDPINRCLEGAIRGCCHPSDETIDAVIDNAYRIFNMAEICNLNTYVQRSRGEILFARKWLLYEGQSEDVILPYFAKILGKDFDASGVSGIIYRSNGSAGPFAKLAKVLSIPWVMLADNDEQGRQTVGEVRNCGYSEDVISSQVLLNSTTDFENELATSNRIFTDYESIVVEEITQDIIELKNSGDVDEYKKEIVKLVQKGKVVNAYKLLDLWSGNALSADDIPEVYVNAILGVCE